MHFRVSGEDMIMIDQYELPLTEYSQIQFRMLLLSHNIRRPIGHEVSVSVIGRKERSHHKLLGNNVPSAFRFNARLFPDRQLFLVGP